MDEQRKYAIPFAATALAARKLNDPETKPWGIECAISDAIGKAECILQKIDERWSLRNSDNALVDPPKSPH
jgi:hypothetical protein